MVIETAGQINFTIHSSGCHASSPCWQFGYLLPIPSKTVRGTNEEKDKSPLQIPAFCEHSFLLIRLERAFEIRHSEREPFFPLKTQF